MRRWMYETLDDLLYGLSRTIKLKGHVILLSLDSGTLWQNIAEICRKYEIIVGCNEYGHWFIDDTPPHARKLEQKIGRQGEG